MFSLIMLTLMWLAFWSWCFWVTRERAGYQDEDVIHKWSARFVILTPIWPIVAFVLAARLIYKFSLMLWEAAVN